MQVVSIGQFSCCFLAKMRKSISMYSAENFTQNFKSKSLAPDKRGIHIIFSFFSTKTCCEYSLKVP